MSRAGTQIGIPAGDVLCKEGAVGREAFVLLGGTASVKRGSRKIATVGPGACIGELALLDPGPRTATVVADTDLDVLVLAPGEFFALLDEVPTIARKLLTTLAGRVRELDKKTFG